MNDQVERENSDAHANAHANAEAEAATAEVVGRGVDITEAVRDITLQALSQGRLDKEKIRGVVQSVVSGAGEGSQNKQESSSVANLREALSGIDEALANSVQASRLAIEEAAGQVGEF